MKLVAVEITPDGNTVMITGKNGAGKSCVLDAITAALCGKKALPQKPIRDNEDHAEIRIETENYIVKRTFTKEGGGTLTITNAEGMEAKSPQTLLDKIVGEIAFDPGKFIRLGEDEKGRREQREILMTLVGLDFSDIDEELDKIKEQRSAAKYRKESAEHNLTPAEDWDSVLPDEAVSVEELTEKLKVANQHNNALGTLAIEIETAKAKTATAEQDISRCKGTILHFQDEIEKEKKSLKLAQQRLSQCVEKQSEVVKQLEPRIDVDAIQAEINQAHQTNSRIEKREQRKTLLAEVETARKEFSELGKKMAEVEGKKAKRLAEAKMPIPGLGVDDSGVVFEGIPFSQTNTAKKLEIAVAISMALNPKLRVIRMDGNSLDSTSLKAIQKMVKDKDYQIWLEVADETGEVGIFIEEGKVATINK